jgi:predicted O-methyltransferase YrrM
LYNTFKLAKKYIRYYITASNGKGHGIHSPFVFEFIQKILTDTKKYNSYTAIEQQRKILLQNNNTIEVTDFGAGSNKLKSTKRKIKNIAASSLKPKKFAQLLFRIVQFYQPATIIELGTSLGITTCYLAKANEQAIVYTCEGAAAIAQVAAQQFSALQIKNINLTIGDFATTLSPLLQSITTIDLAFIDGNHRKVPTIAYFETLLQVSNTHTIFIFDDIHWSEEMEAAWQYIQQHAAVTLTVDLFFIGIVCINPTIKQKQQFTIRF